MREFGWPQSFHPIDESPPLRDWGTKDFDDMYATVGEKADTRDGWNGLPTAPLADRTPIGFRNGIMLMILIILIIILIILTYIIHIYNHTYYIMLIILPQKYPRAFLGWDNPCTPAIEIL